MDILPLPEDPAFPTPDTPYLVIEEWDLGLFLTYLDRKYQDLDLEKLPSFPNYLPVLSVPVQRTFDALPATKLQPFLQTWLYFGLIAEFLGLNETPDGKRLVSLEQAQEDMHYLHQSLSEQRDDGPKLLLGAPVMTLKDHFAERIRLFEDSQKRYEYLHNCLSRTMFMVNNCYNQMDFTVRYSISALGELLMTTLYTSSHSTAPKVVMPSAAFAWFTDYLIPDGDVERNMLGFGWCPSEIEKIRNLYQGVASLHYVTRLKQRSRAESHKNCSRHACRAFQIDMTQYRPRHATDGCACAHVHVDERELSNILQNTESYPVLRVDTAPNGTVQLSMETYEPGINYVALSHVWADGLGNPTNNALPACQISKVAEDVAQLNRDMNEDQSPQAAYRVWIDTICCPVEREGKAIALQRIAGVYSNATHVLVLESSLICLNTTTCHIAERMLRTFTCSAWMRRLWTVQEAILTKSLCIQFEDKAISTQTMIMELYVEGMQDMRVLRIWNEILTETNLIKPIKSAISGIEDMAQHPQLIMLQRLLHFRTVSVPSDEPLCISTIMGLEIEGLTSMTCGEQRMIEIWRALSAAFNGLPSTLVFFLEETLSTPGWRWAPNSLLASLTGDSTLTIDDRTARFTVAKSAGSSAVGIPTPNGLRIQAMGGFLTVREIRKGFGLEPWKGVAKRMAESHVLIYRESTGEWYRAADRHRAHKLKVWTDEQRAVWDEENPSPLFDSIRGNKASVVFNDSSPNAEVILGIIGEVTGRVVDDSDAILFRRARTVMFWRLPDRDVKLLNKTLQIGNRLADSKEAAELGACGEAPSPERDECTAKVREWLKKEVDHEWETDPEFSESVANVMGDDMEGSTWPVVIVDYSNIITMKDSAANQVWYID